MLLDYYKTLEEKKKIFESKNIDSVGELITFINEQNKNSETTIFRGMSEAKYKLYNSGQRYFIQNDLNLMFSDLSEFIIEEIEEIKNYQNGLLFNYYTSFYKNPNDFLLLSLLQHYNGYTPLLDWTYNFNVALYFAMPKDDIEHETDINDYISIYQIDLSNCNELNKYYEEIEEARKKIDKEKKAHPDRSTEDVDNELTNEEYKFLKDFKQLYIKGFRNQQIVNPQNNLFNLNMIAQEGCFIMNNSRNPLEYFFDPETKEGKPINLPKIKCWNIKKSLIISIRTHLTSLNPAITKEYLFPTKENIAKKICENVIFNKINNISEKK